MYVQLEYPKLPDLGPDPVFSKHCGLEEVEHKEWLSAPFQKGKIKPGIYFEVPFMSQRDLCSRENICLCTVPRHCMDEH